MSETITTQRVEPIVDPGPTSGPVLAAERRETAALRDAVQPPPALPAPSVDRPSPVQEQLARLEDKTARIEEKLSRSESATQRVVDRFEAASHRMSEVAQQSDLAAVRSDVKFIARRIRNMPGMSAMVLTAIVSSLLTAAMTAAIFRYLPYLLNR